MEIEEGNETIDIDFEHKKVAIHERYEWLHIINDLMLGIWFVTGSIMFFYGSLTYWGTWLFVAGSAQMLIGPVLKIAHKLHLRRLNLLSHLHF